MANTYVVNTAVQNPITDTLVITGTVNGVPVTVSTWVSAAGAANLASAIGFENFIAPLMLAAYNIIVAPASVAAVPAQGLTFSK